MKIKYIILSILFSLSLVSCDHLDFDETNGLKSKEDMYKYFGTTENMLTHVYSFMPQGFPFNTSSFFTDELAMLDAASDDAEFGGVAASIQNVNNGNWSPIKTYDSNWSLYEGIRAANGFIVEIDNVDFSRYEHNGSYQNWMKKLKYFPYEARVLRAYYFFELAKRYGDIAMPLEVLDKEEANSIGKTAFKDVVSFIVDECDEAAAVLPSTFENEPNKQIGRITKGFAMALKSKALLYAASKLHNPSMDVELWKSSAKASLDIIETGTYSLDNMKVDNDPLSKEIVLARMNDEYSFFELCNFPVRFTEGKSSGWTITSRNYPSQNLVDAFETINGHKVTLENTGWASDDPQFDSQKPYENRDPRFYRTVLANGMEFKESTIETFEGGRDHASVALGGSPTGYFLRRFIQESTSFTPDKEVTNKHHWIIYRYSETLLTYAESMINAFNDPNYTDNVYKYSALWALNEVRQNAGMPVYSALNSQDLIQKLYNEWRVEFAFEGHRFWDVRRWKIADATQRELRGVKIKRNSNNVLNFNKIIFETRNWRDCMYLYPIPQTELYKNRNLNPQNSGW